MPVGSTKPIVAPNQILKNENVKVSLSVRLEHQSLMHLICLECDSLKKRKKKKEKKNAQSERPQLVTVDISPNLFQNPASLSK